MGASDRGANWDGVGVGSGRVGGMAVPTRVTILVAELLQCHR